MDQGLWDAAAMLQHLQQLRRNKVAPSRDSQLVSATRFLHHFLGLELTPIMRSNRSCAPCKQLQAGAAWCRQAAPLKVEEVQYMHRVLQGGELHPFDKAMLAHCLVALHARAGHSDLLNVRRIE